MDKKLPLIYVLIIFSMIFWALSFIWYKEAFVYFQPLTLVFFRLVISVILLIIVSSLFKSFRFLKKNEIRDFMLLAMFEPFFYFLGESYGMQFVSSSLASLIISLIPLFASIAAWYLYKEKLSALNIGGIILSIIGILFVMFFKGFTSEVSIKGIGLMFIAVFAATGYSLMVKKVSLKHNPFMVVTWQNFFGALYFFPMILLFEKDSFISFDFTFQAFKPLLKLSVFASTLAFVFFTYAVKNIGIARSTVFTNAIPVFTAIFAFYIQGESFNYLKITGIILVVIGLFVSQIKKHQNNIT